MSFKITFSPLNYPEGPTGPEGPSGSGSTGPTGPEGPSGSGSTGPTGPQGDTPFISAQYKIPAGGLGVDDLLEFISGTQQLPLNTYVVRIIFSCSARYEPFGPGLFLNTCRSSDSSTLMKNQKNLEIDFGASNFDFDGKVYGDISFAKISAGNDYIIPYVTGNTAGSPELTLTLSVYYVNL